MPSIEVDTRKRLAVTLLLGLVLLIFARQWRTSKVHFNNDTIERSWGQMKQNHSLKNCDRELVSQNEHSQECLMPGNKSIRRLKKSTLLIFQGSGVVKLVIGVSVPIKLSTKDRSMSYYFNLQFQYAQPTMPIYWWTFTNTSKFQARAASTSQRRSQLPDDPGRSYLYKAIEELFNKHGLHGEQCLLHAICDIARVPFYTGGDGGGAKIANTLLAGERASSRDGRHEEAAGTGIAVFHALLNVIFMPQLPNVARKYVKAFGTGRRGINCDLAYPVCAGHGSLWDKVSMILV